MTPTVQTPRRTATRDGVSGSYRTERPARPAPGAARGLATRGPVHESAAPARLSRDEQSAERVCEVISRAVLEVLRGWRPPSQLVLWTTPELQADLERRIPRRPVGARLQLTRLRISRPGPTTAEACAMAYDPGCGRVRVIAFRLERRGSAWTMTRLQAG